MNKIGRWLNILLNASLIYYCFSVWAIFSQEEKFDNNQLIKNDGLSTLEFIEHGVNIINKNFTHINIGI